MNSFSNGRIIFLDVGKYGKILSNGSKSVWGRTRNFIGILASMCSCAHGVSLADTLDLAKYYIKYVVYCIANTEWWNLKEMLVNMCSCVCNNCYCPWLSKKLPFSTWVVQTSKCVWAWVMNFYRNIGQHV